MLTFTMTLRCMRLTRNHHHGFYMAHPKPSPITMGFIWLTRNQLQGFTRFTPNHHHGFYG